MDASATARSIYSSEPLSGCAWASCFTPALTWRTAAHRFGRAPAEAKRPRSTTCAVGRAVWTADGGDHAGEQRDDVVGSNLGEVVVSSVQDEDGCRAAYRQEGPLRLAGLGAGPTAVGVLHARQQLLNLLPGRAEVDAVVPPHRVRPRGVAGFEVSHDGVAQPEHALGRRRRRARLSKGRLRGRRVVRGRTALRQETEVPERAQVGRPQRCARRGGAALLQLQEEHRPRHAAQLDTTRELAHQRPLAHAGLHAPRRGVRWRPRALRGRPPRRTPHCGARWVQVSHADLPGQGGAARRQLRAQYFPAPTHDTRRMPHTHAHRHHPDTHTAYTDHKRDTPIQAEREVTSG